MWIVMEAKEREYFKDRITTLAKRVNEMRYYKIPMFNLTYN